jgi:hypothetical protein
MYTDYVSSAVRVFNFLGSQSDLFMPQVSTSDAQYFIGILPALLVSLIGISML